MDSLEQQIKKLNKEQRQAVETIEGPVLIVAGPGTGKTQMLALRIANIISSTDTNPSSILCLTFTETGVSAMRKRLFKIIGTPAYHVKIHTFHSFCNEIIQNFPEIFAFTKELVQLDDLTQLKILNKLLDSLEGNSEIKHLRPFHDPYAYRKTISSALQNLKREAIDTVKFAEISKSRLEYLENNPELGKRSNKPTDGWKKKVKNAELNIELSIVYQKYQEILQSEGYYDYEDMLMFVIEKFKVNEELLSHFQEKYLYILVDEYQDTNGVQNEVLKYLGSFDSSPNIFAVGDDDQAIFRFQGANLENLLFFGRQFKNVNTILVTTNYRSSQSILDIADSLIASNSTRLSHISKDLDKKLTAGLKISNHKGEVYKFSTGEKENYFIAKKIKEIKESGDNYSDIAIFYRNHAQAEDLIEVLSKEEVPLNLEAGKNLLKNLMIAQFIDLLKLTLFNSEDLDNLLVKILFYSFLNLNHLDAIKITTHLNQSKIFYNKATSPLKIIEILSSKEKLDELELESPESFLNFANNLIKWRSETENTNLSRLIEIVGYESNFIDYIFRDQKDPDNIDAVSSFFSYVKTIERNTRDITLAEFMNDLSLIEENRLSIEQKSISIKKDAVNLMTAHKSKGLEFKHVFIIKCTENIWGKQKKRSYNIQLPSFSENVDLVLGEDIDYEIEDQRRLFFVAITRAQERIYFTLSDEYSDGGNKKSAIPSRFLQEIDDSLLEKEDTSRFEEIGVEEVRRQNIPTRELSVTEKQYLEKIVENFRLSATALNSYIECPLKFKYERLLNIPIKYNKELVLGSALHKALENFFRNLKLDHPIDKEMLINAFNYALENELITKKDFADTSKEGVRILDGYFEEYKDTFRKPLQLEYKFNGRDIVLPSEKTFPIQLSGRIDKIEPISSDDGSLDVRVVDYKKSSPASANDIKGLTKNSDGSRYRQLLFYKVLADSDPNFKPSLSSPKYRIQELEIDYLKPDSKSKKYRKVNFPVVDSDVEELKHKIEDVMIRIRNLEFNGSDEYPLCDECEWCKM